MKREFVVLLSLIGPPLQAQLAYDPPQGWSRVVNPNTGVASFSPPGLAPSRVAVMIVFQPDTFSGSAVDYHTEIVRRTATNARQLEASRQGTIGSFQVTLLHELMPTGMAVWLRVYTARWADSGQTFIFTTNARDVTIKYAPVADSMIARITAARPQVATTPPSSSPAQPSRPGQIDGVYLTLKNKGGFNAGVSKDYMVFFPNGEVFWHLPQEGLLDFDVAGSHRDWNDFWGHYEMQGGRFQVTFNTGPDYSGLRNGDGTLLIGGYTYVRQTGGPDGRTLRGTYRAYNLGQDPSRDVTFYPDGRFDDRGIRGAVGALDLAYGRAKVPTDPGSGRYRIARYSIVFEYSDGRREQLSFYVPGDDGGNTPKQLVINTFNVVRVSP